MHPLELHDEGEELEQPHVIYLWHVDLPPLFDFLEAQIRQVKMVIEQLAHDCYNDQNEVISFVNEIQHNQMYILD